MKTIITLGMAGGFLFVARGWITLFFTVLVAARISHTLAMVIFKEALKAGWFDATR